MIQNITDKLPKHSTKKPQRRKLSDIEAICIHHSGVSGGDIWKHARFHTSEAVRDKAGNWLGRGWSVVAYTFSIDPQGRIFQCNALETISPHSGTLVGNRTAIGILIEGDLNNSEPTGAQLESIVELKQHLDNELGLILDTKFHRDYKKTSCPGEKFPYALVTNMLEKIYPYEEKQDEAEKPRDIASNEGTAPARSHEKEDAPEAPIKVEASESPRKRRVELSWIFTLLKYLKYFFR